MQQMAIIKGATENLVTKALCGVVLSICTSSGVGRAISV